jgi:outer membrane protein
LISLLVAACSALATYQILHKPKIAYVRIDHLLENFEGTKLGSELLYNKTVSWESKIDSVKTAYFAQVKSFVEDSVKLSVSEKNRQKEKLALMQIDIRKLSSEYERSFKSEDESISLGVINQVHTFLKEYGKENNYAMILGADSNSGLVYGDDRYDITDEVLIEINKNFKASGGN